MLSIWSETPADFALEEYLERYGDAIEACPERYAGIWAKACYPLTAKVCSSIAGETVGPSYREVRLDLGCGKGAFTVGSARRKTDTLFVGIDIDPVSVAIAARLAVGTGTHNAVFVPGRDGTLQSFFAPGELSTIYLNFPTPHPKGREASQRLTYAGRLRTYRQS